MSGVAPRAGSGIALKLVVLKSMDLERLREFYAVVGMHFVPERHGNGPRHYSGAVGSAVLELYPLEGEALSPSQPARLGLSVPDLGATFQALETSGVVVLSPPCLTAWGGRGVVRDPDGRTVELYQS